MRKACVKFTLRFPSLSDFEKRKKEVIESCKDAMRDLEITTEAEFRERVLTDKTAVSKIFASVGLSKAKLDFSKNDIGSSLYYILKEELPDIIRFNINMEFDEFVNRHIKEIIGGK